MQHNSYENSVEDTMPEDQEVCITRDIVDGPCLIANMEKFLKQTWDIEY